MQTFPCAMHMHLRMLVGTLDSPFTVLLRTCTDEKYDPTMLVHAYTMEQGDRGYDDLAADVEKARRQGRIVMCCILTCTTCMPDLRFLFPPREAHPSLLNAPRPPIQIGSPLQQLSRAGFGLLASGIGRLGGVLRGGVGGGGGGQGCVRVCVHSFLCLSWTVCCHVASNNIPSHHPITTQPPLLRTAHARGLRHWGDQPPGAPRMCGCGAGCTGTASPDGAGTKGACVCIASFLLEGVGLLVWGLWVCWWLAEGRDRHAWMALFDVPWLVAWLIDGSALSVLSDNHAKPQVEQLVLASTSLVSPQTVYERTFVLA